MPRDSEPDVCAPCSGDGAVAVVELEDEGFKLETAVGEVVGCAKEGVFEGTSVVEKGADRECGTGVPELGL